MTLSVWAALLLIELDNALKSRSAATSLTFIATFSLLFPFSSHSVHSALPSFSLLVSLLAAVFGEYYKSDNDTNPTTQPIGATFLLSLKICALILQVLQYFIYFYNAFLEARFKFPLRSLPFWDHSMQSGLYKCFNLRYSETDQYVDTPFTMDYLSEIFKSNWQHAYGLNNRLLAACSYMLLKPLLLTISMRLIASVFLFARVESICRFISFLEQDIIQDNIWQHIISVIFIWTGFAYAMTIYLYFNHCLTIYTRGALLPCILAYSTRITRSSAKDMDPISIASTEAEELANIYGWLSEPIAAVFQVAISFSYLYYLYGWLLAVVLLLVLVSIIAIHFCSGRRLHASKLLDKAHVMRLHQMANCIPFFKIIKIAGLEPIMKTLLKSAYRKEVELFQSSILWRFVNVFFTVMVESSISPLLLTLILPTLCNEARTVASVFTIALHAGIIGDSLGEIIDSCGYIIFAIIPLEKIQRFLSLPRVYSFDELQQRQVLRSNRIQLATGIHPSRLIPAAHGTIFEHRYTSIAVDNRAPVLFGINLTVQRHQKLMITGRMGSGKSTFLRALLGEVSIVTGELHVNNTPLAYCAQAPWLRNTSIRDNVLSIHEFDIAWYHHVLDTCCLSEDIEELPDLDLTSVGVNGTRLNGSQRCRVTLARALYAKPKLLLLDDIFSSLDRATAYKVYQRLFSSTGYFKQIPSTLIMVTNTAEIVQFADQVLLIESSGHIMVETDLNNPAFQSNLAQVLLPLNEMHKKVEETPARIIRPAFRYRNMPTERSSKSATLSNIYYYIKAAGFWRILLWLPVSILHGFITSIPLMALSHWLDDTAYDSILYSRYLLICSTASAICALAFILCWKLMIKVPSINMHTDLLATLTNATWSFLSSCSHEDMLSPFLDNMRSYQTLSVVLTHALHDLTAFITFLALAGSVSQITLAYIPCFLFPLLRYCFNRLKKQQNIDHLESRVDAKIAESMHDILDGIEHIRAPGQINQHMVKVLAMLDESQALRFKEYCVKDFTSFSINLFTAIAAVGILLVSVVLQQAVTPASVATSLACLLLCSRSMIPSLRWMVAISSQLQVMENLNSFLQSTPKEPKLVHIRKEPIPHIWPARGDITIQNLVSKYSPNIEAPKVLDNLSLEITSGQKVGIIGSTGSGKTSLLLSILNCLNYTGTIVIDGIDISTLPRHELRKRITTISQDIIELKGTLRFNLIPYIMGGQAHGTIDEDNIFEVLRRLNLYEHVQGYGGIDLPLEEYKFSQGQLQLVGIGRAILHSMETKSRVVLMDEPSSNLDWDTASMIHEAMEDAFPHCTVFMVAHRVELLLKTDVIIKIDKGKIVAKSTNHREDGLPDSLLA